ncbi:alpha/beta fold hydrolase, partial [Amycolatopsis sp. NPDC047767]|uniref:thioesterase II family protein n=1 Tax=Amycolatopsis sp. NPDC047767 TaxID=3156765 RepID=UPI00345418AD
MTVGVAQRWLRRFSSPPAPRLRLACFAHAGGSASFFRTWPRSLPADVEVLAIRYPGRQDRLAEPCAQRLDDLVDDVAAALAEPLADGVPFAFFGHSMGSAIAFETARRLEARWGLRAGGGGVIGPPRPPPRRKRARHTELRAAVWAAVCEV